MIADLRYVELEGMAPQVDRPDRVGGVAPLPLPRRRFLTSETVGLTIGKWTDNIFELIKYHFAKKGSSRSTRFQRAGGWCKSGNGNAPNSPWSDPPEL